MSVNSKGGGKGKGQDGGEGGSSSEGTEHATLMYKNMNPENATFVNLLVERAEVSGSCIKNHPGDPVCLEDGGVGGRDVSDRKS